LRQCGVEEEDERKGTKERRRAGKSREQNGGWRGKEEKKRMKPQIDVEGGEGDEGKEEKE
jgi:hypothetical protein